MSEELTLMHGVRARTLRMVCSGQAGDEPSQCYAASMSEELTLTRGVRARTLRMAGRSCTNAACGWAFVHERCVWFARGKPVMDRPSAMLQA